MGQTQYATDERSASPDPSHHRQRRSQNSGVAIIGALTLLVALMLAGVNVASITRWETQLQNRHDSHTRVCAEAVTVPVAALQEAATRPHDPLLAIDGNPVYRWSYDEVVDQRCPYLGRESRFLGLSSPGALAIYALSALGIFALWRGLHGTSIREPDTG